MLVLHRWTVRPRREARGYSKTSSRQVGLSGRLVAAHIKIPIPTQRRFQRMKGSQLFISTGKLEATEYQGCSGKPEIPEGSEDSKLKSRIWPHHFHTSPDCVPRMEKVFSIVRKIYDWKPTDNIKDFDVNTAIWSILISVTLQAAVHLGRDYSLNLRSSRINLQSLWIN